MPGTASRGAEPRVVVHVLKGRAAKRAREMTGPTLLLGADAQCDVQLRSPDIAPKHCLISRQNGRVMATRLQADFPLLKNGAPIAEDDLADGDRLAVGPFELTIGIGAAESSPVPDAGRSSRPVHRSHPRHPPSRRSTPPTSCGP